MGSGAFGNVENSVITIICLIKLLLSKIGEKIIEMQIRKHLGNNVLPVTQSGFRSDNSCSTALTHIIIR